MEFSKPDFLKRLDDPEPIFPGEHWAALAGGLAAWYLTRKHPSLAVRTLGVFIGASLVARAAHGHPTLGNVMRLTPVGGGIRRDEDDVV